MKLQDLLEVVGDEPVFDSSLLFAAQTDIAAIQRQLSRWTKHGTLHQLRRSLYALAPPWRKVPAHPFLVANRMIRASYVSLQSALQHHGLIPEYVPVTTSVTTGSPGRWTNPLGTFQAQHIAMDLFFGYRLENLGAGQHAFIAWPEKALLDLIHLHHDGASPDYIGSLRLQNLDRLSLDRLQGFAGRAMKPKLSRAVPVIAALAEREAQEYEVLA